jgi:PHD/YefM family antitoxin component YafN of YafNO toxin-antitoxin module
MKQVNALTIRNRLGEVLDMLARDGEPVAVSKGRQIRAVLVSPSDFQRRFVDKLAEEARQNLLERIGELRRPRRGERSSLEVLRELRGQTRAPR